MNKRYDVIIAGGGVIGCSIAYHLRKYSSLSVLVLERQTIGCEASMAAGGMLGAQAEIHETGPLYEMARESRSRFPMLAHELKESSGIDIEFVDRGLLKVAWNEEDAAYLQSIRAFHTNNHQPAEWVDSRQLKSMEPHLNGELFGALYLPKDGQVSAARLTKAFAQGAIERGATICEYAEVQKIEVTAHGVKVGSNAGEYFAEKFVAASGVWTEQLAKLTDLSLPLYPVKGECLSLTFPKPPIASTVISGHCYLVPKRGGRLLIGATMRPDTFDKKVTAGGVLELLDQATTLVPEVKLGQWEKAWTGFRPQTIDGLPYLGAHPENDSLYFAAGHYRNGILLSPLTGEWIAQAILGHAPLAMEAFSPNRVSMLQENKGMR
ncbi:glycine oxidase [Fictibacillus macauensis ZFHKF-1]|uniref:glycine oxidase n=1 Tax=Fictibacillus macauensis ZFHKF-1 TaxID=1196324 RepID=I8J1X4_9BACL|nr:glycine oxidase ThiO [Fictibacillus macauensis]EIT85746.1 glycine oxidase [Fictibacillus macauensis ZFHKF-1]